MDIILLMVGLHLVWYLPCYLPILEKQFGQYLDKSGHPGLTIAGQNYIHADDTVSKRIPYYCDGKLVKYLEMK